MKKLFLLASSLFLITPAVNAVEITSRLTDSVQLTVDGAASAVTRIGNSYSVSGSGVSTTDGTTAGVVGGLGSATNGVNSFTSITASQATSGSAFSFTQSYTEGDSTNITSTSVTSGLVGSLPLFGQTTTSSGGVAGSLAGTLSSTGVPTITAGGAGTTAIGQRSLELSVFK